MSNFVNLLSNAIVASPAFQIGEIKRTSPRSTSSNPFSTGNPFVRASHENPFSTYGQNKPVIGGYFAGYYNNQPNIVVYQLY